jgi:hypothetical protein
LEVLLESHVEWWLLVVRAVRNRSYISRGAEGFWRAFVAELLQPSSTSGLRFEVGSWPPLAVVAVLSCLLCALAGL